MSKRLRGFKRHTYTVGRRITIPEEGWMFMRGEGSIASSPSVQSIQTPEAPTDSFDMISEINIHTKQDYPRLGSGQSISDPDGFGRTFNPDYIKWNGVEYVCYGLNLWNGNGQSNYRKITAIYDSGNDLGNDRFKALSWEEISEFEEATNKTEMALELKLAKIDLCSLS